MSKVTSIVVQRVCRIPAESCRLPSGPHGVVLIEFTGTGEREGKKGSKKLEALRGRRPDMTCMRKVPGVDGKTAFSDCCHVPERSSPSQRQ